MRGKSQTFKVDLFSRII